jgi:hypothetical protein
MQWDKERVVATSFILLSVGSAAFLSVSTLNYLNYYPAIAGIHLQIDSITVVSGSNQSRIDTRVTIINPTNYAGLRLWNLIVDLVSFRVRDNNATLFGSGMHPREEDFVGRQLGANSVVSSDVITQLNPANATSFSSFVNSYNGRVIASVQFTAQIVTFLITVYGFQYYMTAQDLSLTSS